MSNKLAGRVQAATALLGALAVRDIHACICGGYARDTICDKPIRDVDVYVEDRHYAKAYRTLFGEGAIKVGADEGDAYVHQAIYRQQEVELTADQTVKLNLEVGTINLIGLREDIQPLFTEIVSRFNLGICKAGIDYHEGLQITDDFKRDYKDKQITLLRSDWGHEATLKQWIKLQAKYPWPLRLQPQQELF